MKLQQIGRIFVADERVFCFSPHFNAVHTLLCKILITITQSDKRHSASQTRKLRSLICYMYNDANV